MMSSWSLACQTSYINEMKITSVWCIHIPRNMRAFLTTMAMGIFLTFHHLWKFKVNWHVKLMCKIA